MLKNGCLRGFQRLADEPINFGITVVAVVDTRVRVPSNRRCRMRNTGSASLA